MSIMVINISFTLLTCYLSLFLLLLMLLCFCPFIIVVCSQSTVCARWPKVQNFCKGRLGLSSTYYTGQCGPMWLEWAAKTQFASMLLLSAPDGKLVVELTGRCTGWIYGTNRQVSRLPPCPPLWGWASLLISSAERPPIPSTVEEVSGQKGTRSCGQGLRGMDNGRKDCLVSGQSHHVKASPVQRWRQGEMPGYASREVFCPITSSLKGGYGPCPHWHGGVPWHKVSTQTH